MNDKIIIKKILSDTEFLVQIPEMKANLIMKQIPSEEDLKNWVQLPPHTNVVGCLDTFEHSDGDKLLKFSLQEQTNNGDMFKYIQTINLNLGFNIPLHYMETIYDCMIQVTLGMEFAHNNGLVHG